MEILQERGVEFDVIEYIKNPVGEAVLRRFLELLEVEPKHMLHPGSFEDLGLNIDDYNTPDALVGLLLEHPEVMNRPVCIRGDQAVIARPAELVNEILD
ncbi:MAG: ArsC/Spx/MgsR family protein [Candidatus Latescibacteria bacterium]|jgi:arsenate reductase|nr:ArsC/Spx/MgsR family protein [Candidatus Latescibacterota bacterium]